MVAKRAQKVNYKGERMKNEKSKPEYPTLRGVQRSKHTGYCQNCKLMLCERDAGKCPRCGAKDPS